MNRLWDCNTLSILKQAPAGNPGSGGSGRSPPPFPQSLRWNIVGFCLSRTLDSKLTSNQYREVPLSRRDKTRSGELSQMQKVNWVRISMHTGLSSRARCRMTFGRFACHRAALGIVLPSVYTVLEADMLSMVPFERAAPLFFQKGTDVCKRWITTEDLRGSEFLLRRSPVHLLIRACLC